MDDNKLTRRFISENLRTNIKKIEISENFNRADGIVSVEILSNKIMLLFYKQLHTVDFIEKEHMSLDISLLRQKVEKDCYNNEIKYYKKFK